jgi:hypothetical protein
MKYLLLLVLLFPLSLTATSFVQPEPKPIEVGKYVLFTNEELDREIIKNSGSIINLEIRRNKDGRLFCDLGDESVSRITQFEDHFILEVSQMSKGYHCITTYVGSFSSKKYPISYSGTYVYMLYRQHENELFTETRKGVFTIIGKFEDERK